MADDAADAGQLLCTAAESGDTQKVRVLCTAGAAVNSARTDGSSALLLAAVLLLCPLFRLGTWLAEQRFAAQRRMALDVRLDETDPEDDNDDHEAEAKEDGALQGADLEGERV